jgi:predicted nuclease of predicted toxin-antitoxin system
MARFKTDENIPSVVVRALIDAGHDVMTVADQGLTGSDDASLAQICDEEGRIVVTLDRGFADPRYRTAPTRHGVVVLRPATYGPGSCLALVRSLLPKLLEQDPTGALWIVSPDRIRIRQR